MQQGEQGCPSSPQRLPLATLAVVTTVVIANLGNTITAPVMPEIRDQFGATAAEVGLVASGFALGRLLMDLPAGFLADRINITKLFAVAILVSAAAAAAASFSSSLPQLVLFRTVMGCGCALMSTVAIVLLVDMAGPQRRGEVLAYYTSALLFGQAISPLIGGFLATLFDWRATFLFCAITPFASLPLNLIATSRVARTQRPSGTRAAHASGRGTPGKSAGQSGSRTNWLALVVVYFSTFANFFNRQAMRQSLLPLYGGMVLAMKPGTIGTVLTAGSLLTIAVTLPCGKLADRIGRKPLLIPGLMTLCLGNLALFLGQSHLFFVVATLLVSMGVMANSMQSGLVADLLPERLMGRGIGMYRFVGDLGMLVGPILLGIVVDGFGFDAALIVGSVVILAGVLAVVAFIPGRGALTARGASVAPNTSGR